jgi:antitoxin ParD1/3/4
MAISAELGTTLEDYVSQLVSSGRYNSKSEVLREGIRLLHERESRLAILDLAIARGNQEVDEGKTKPMSEVFDRIENKYNAMARPS